MDKNMTRIRYTPDETGWAEMIGTLRARIANVPLTETLNIDDVVELKDNGDLLDSVVRVVERPFPKKSVVRYEPADKPTYTKLYKALEGAGMKCEGAVAGMMVVAHAKGSPAKLAKLAGIKVQVQQFEMSKP